MANQWLRLWHDMPTDPKWRTIARISGQPLALVQAVYVHLLVDASRNVTRGHATVTVEDLASSLDVTDDAIDSILRAMEGRVIDAGRISGWEKRQPKREDHGDHETGAKSPAERKREQRERERLERELAAEQAADKQCHDESRNVTTDKDKDKDKDVNLNPSSHQPAADDGSASVESLKTRIPECPHQQIIALYESALPELPQPRVWDGEREKNLRARWKWLLTAKKKSGERYAEGEAAALDFFRRLFAYVAESDFLTGRSGAWQGCNLAWLVKAENFAKVIEGHYENKEAA